MIPSAARFIIGGGVVVYPTETVYGLGANALDEQAVMRVFLIKKRPLSMPISLAVSSLEMLREVAEVRDEDMDILEDLLPGPVSILLRKKSIVPDILTAGSSLVGIRFPDHESALRIIDKAGPITSTSANRTGQPAPVSAKEVSKEIEDRVELVVDGGRCKYCQPSTLLDLENRKIIRPGAGLVKALKAIK
ncbi:MAG TPA: L-threonylcarbamoyladenylate synthase [Methanothrix soehngenii]|nr:L-threonylcarbamoyladenylate synthase [Methanothrix soehngenii]